MSSPLKLKGLKESGELRSLFAEIGELDDWVVAAPKEKPGEGRGPGMGDEMMRELIAYK